jgi:transposase
MNLVYATELTVDQWKILEPLIPRAKSIGRPRSVSLLMVIQAILYVIVTGCAWRLLLKDYPPYSTVYYYFRQWRDDGTWEPIHDALYQQTRLAAHRLPSPSAASLDSQSVPTAVMVHEAVGFDSGKKLDGRKRFTLVDTLGLLMAVHGVAANVPEREGAKQLPHKLNQERERFPRLARIWVDGGVSGADFFHWVVDTFGGYSKLFYDFKTLRDLSCCRSGGSLSALMVGYIGVVGSMWTMSDCLPLLSP